MDHVSAEPARQRDPAELDEPGLTPAPPPPRRTRMQRATVIIRWVLAVVVVIAAVVAAWSRRQELQSGFEMLGNLSWQWLLVAVAFEAASMVAFARLQRWLLHSGGVDVGLRDMIEITLAGNALGTTLPGGVAWSAGWAWGQLRRRGANRVLAGWVVLVAGALSSFALFVLVVVGAEIAGNHGPVASLRWLGRSLAAIPIAGLLSWAVWRHCPPLRAWVSRNRVLRAESTGRWGGVLVRLSTLQARIRVVRPRPLAWIEAFALAMANWACNLGCLIFCIFAVHATVPWRGIVVAYALTQISASLPITPGGLAVVEASLAALLTAYGMPASNAVAVVVLYRIVSFWALVPLGWVVWGYLQTAEHRRPARRHPWGHHDQVPVNGRDGGKPSSFS
jgi:uncharacterized membrane protein YbhN (UPF0104 family)